MYNEERKSAFLSAFSNSLGTKKNVSSILSAFEPYECAFGVDFCEFNMDMLSKTIPGAKNIRSATAKYILSSLRSYVKWCKLNGYKVNDAIFAYEYDASQSMRLCYVRSPEHLKKILDFVFFDCDTNSIEYIYKSYLWLAFFGLNESQASAVRVSDVDFDNLLVRLPSGDAFELYLEAKPDLLMACGMDAFFEMKNVVRKVNRAAGDEILRGKVSKKSVYDAVTTTFKTSVSRALARAEESLQKEDPLDNDLLSMNLSFKRVYLSGLFFRIFQGEKNGAEPDFHLAVRKQYDRADVAYHAVKSIEKDYESWKRAFGL